MRSPQAQHGLPVGPRLLTPRLDVQDLSSVEGAIAEALGAFGGIDALVNNAGYGAYGALEATPLDKAVRQFEVNVLGVLAVTKVVIPSMRLRRRGTIVNVSSIGGRLAFPLGALYHASKFAVEGLTEALQYELAPLGIRTVLVEPGMVNTDFGGSSFDFSVEPALSDYAPLQQSLLSVMGAMMTDAAAPEEVAAAILAACEASAPPLRWVVGADAAALLSQRATMGDEGFFSTMRQQFDVATVDHG